jgi:hypothetical protein
VRVLETHHARSLKSLRGFQSHDVVLPTAARPRPIGTVVPTDDAASGFLPAPLRQPRLQRLPDFIMAGAGPGRCSRPRHLPCPLCRAAGSADCVHRRRPTCRLCIGIRAHGRDR